MSCTIIKIFLIKKKHVFLFRLSDNNIEIRKLAQYGAMDLILKAPHQVLPVLPKLILPLKRSFNTRDKKIIIGALKVLQLMVLVGTPELEN